MEFLKRAVLPWLICVSIGAFLYTPVNQGFAKKIESSSSKCRENLPDNIRLQVFESDFPRLTNNWISEAKWNKWNAVIDKEKARSLYQLGFYIDILFAFSIAIAVFSSACLFNEKIRRGRFTLAIKITVGFALLVDLVEGGLYTGLLHFFSVIPAISYVKITLYIISLLLLALLGLCFLWKILVVRSSK